MTQSTPQLRAEVIRPVRRLHWAALLMGLAILPIAAAPWHDRPLTAVVVSDVVVHADVWSLDVPDTAAMPNAWQLGHPDSRPWPHGMVIGTRPHPDRNQLRQSSALDTVVSVLLVPWRMLGA